MALHNSQAPKLAEFDLKIKGDVALPEAVPQTTGFRTKHMPTWYPPSGDQAGEIIGSIEVAQLPPPTI